MKIQIEKKVQQLKNLKNNAMKYNMNVHPVFFLQDYFKKYI